MFFNRNKQNFNDSKRVSKKPCARCSIIRLYLLSVLTIILIGIFAEDKAFYIQKIDKLMLVYIIFSFGFMLTFYKIFEWIFFIKKSK